MPHKSNVVEFNIDRLKSLNCPVARINVIHTGGSKVRKVDAKRLECQLLLARGVKIMLRTNLWIETSLVNSSVGTVQEIIFEENQSPPSLPIAVLIEFNNYSDSTIIIEDKRLVLISLIRHNWKGIKALVHACKFLFVLHGLSKYIRVRN